MNSDGFGSHRQEFNGFKVGDLVKPLGVPNAVGIVIDIYVTNSQLYDEICWIKILWTDLGPPANWERIEWVKPFQEEIFKADKAKEEK